MIIYLKLKVSLIKSLCKILYINFQRQNLGPIRNDVDVDYDLTSHDVSILYKLFKKPRPISKKKYSLLKNISDISNLHLKLDNAIIDINNSWINPNKIRKLQLLGQKNVIIYELDQLRPITVYNQYVKYRSKLFDNKFLKSKAYIYFGKNYSIKTKTYPLNNEIKHFFDFKKPFTNIDFGIKIFNFKKLFKILTIFLFRLILNSDQLAY